MFKWFDLFSVWGYRNPNRLGLDLDITVLGIGTEGRALFGWRQECGAKELSVFWMLKSLEKDED